MTSSPSAPWPILGSLGVVDPVKLFLPKVEINEMDGTIRELGAMTSAYITQACKGIARW